MIPRRGRRGMPDAETISRGLDTDKIPAHYVPPPPDLELAATRLLLALGIDDDRATAPAVEVLADVWDTAARRGIKYFLSRMAAEGKVS